MTSKGRLMTALNRGKPDRLPVTIHQWQGCHLDEYMGGISDLEACHEVGLDAQIQYFQDMGQFWLVDADLTKLNTPTWRDSANVISNDPENRIVHHTIHTPEGTLAYKTAGDRKTTWITEYLIKWDEEIHLIDNCGYASMTFRTSSKAAMPSDPGKIKKRSDHAVLNRSGAKRASHPDCCWAIHKNRSVRIFSLTFSDGLLIHTIRSTGVLCSLLFTHRDATKCAAGLQRTFVGFPRILSFRPRRAPGFPHRFPRSVS